MRSPESVTFSRELDHNQLLRAKKVFEKLGQPSDEFYLQIRNTTTVTNKGTKRRSGMISVMMPYSYWYHRLGEALHDQYPGYMDPTVTIGFSQDYPGDALLNYFADWPEDQDSMSFSGGSKFGISQPISGQMIDESKLSSFERFADRIIEEWEVYKANQNAATTLHS
jgi:hypothetical protein